MYNQPVGSTLNFEVSGTDQCKKPGCKRTKYIHSDDFCERHCLVETHNEINSYCCAAGIDVSTADEGTSFWVCKKCGKATDPQQDNDLEKLEMSDPEDLGATIPLGELLSEYNLETLKAYISAREAALLARIREAVEKEIAIHEQLEKEAVGRIKDILAGNDSINPHTEKLESLRHVLNLLTE